MKKAEIINTMNATFNKVSFKLRKHSPEILVVAGVVGVVASAVMACKATTKINTILDETKQNVDKIHDCMADESLSEEYSPEDGQKDLAVVYVQTGVKLAKLYAPAIMLGTLSITSIVASNNILRKRNVALAAAYATVDRSFKEYRHRIVERFGEEIDREIRYNIKAKKFDEFITDENGKEKKAKAAVNVTEGPNSESDYARFFDSGCPAWEKNPEYNLMFLRSEQNLANDRLKSRGYLFLNDVYERLGIPPTKAGQVVGWVYNEENPMGDNYVDFGMYNVNREKTRDFVNGYEPVILLDFNVDGNIWELM